MADATYSVAVVRDPRIDYVAPRVLPARVGPNSFTSKRFSAPDPTTTSPTITVQSPSYNTAIGRVVLYHMKATLKITGTDLDNLLGQAGGSRIALRAFPIHSACSAVTLSINDVTTSLPSPFSTVATLLSQGFSSHSMALTCSTVPSAPDVLSEYSDCSAVSVPFATPLSAPFSNFAAASRTNGIVGARILDPGAAGDPNFNTQAEVDIDIWEPLLASPFSFCEESLMKGLIGINSLQLAMQITEPHRMLSLNLGGVGAGQDCTVTGVVLAPTLQDLECTFCTAEPRSQVDRPLALSYDFTTVQLFTTSLGGTVQPGQFIDFTAPVVELPVVPAYLLIKANYSTPDLKNQSKSLADVSFPVSKVSMSFGSRSGLLSGMTVAQLYQISITAGANIPFSQWTGQEQFTSGASAANSFPKGAGGVLIIDGPRTVHVRRLRGRRGLPSRGGRRPHHRRGRFSVSAAGRGAGPSHPHVHVDGRSAVRQQHALGRGSPAASDNRSHLRHLAEPRWGLAHPDRRHPGHRQLRLRGRQ